MYLAVDIGGTKTLLATFTEQGKISDSIKFPTPRQYHHFLQELEHYFKKLETQDFERAVAAVPGLIDREHGRVNGYGTLTWGPAPVQHDLARIFNTPTTIENDTKLAGLSEANLIINEFKRVLYVTISTGISDALIIDGILDPAMLDSEAGQMWLEYRGKVMQWEDFASGRAIVEHYGKRASELNDPQAWKEVSDNIATGLIELIVVVQPEVIVLGGGVSTHYDKFIGLLKESLKQYELPLTPIPPIRQAKRPEEAVIYGCYELAKSRPSSKVISKTKTGAKAKAKK